MEPITTKAETTDTKDLVYTELVEVELELAPITVEQAIERIYDLELPLQQRIQAVEVYYTHFPEGFENILGRLFSMFGLSNVSVLQKYLLAICSLEQIHILNRLESVVSLCYAVRNAEQAYALLADLCATKHPQLPLVVYVDRLFVLISHDNTHAPLFMENILLNTTLSIEDRYKYLVLSKTKVGSAFFKNTTISFMERVKLPPRTCILCCSNLMGNKDITLSQEEMEHLTNLLVTISESTMVNTNARADALDVLLQYGRIDARQKARDDLLAMGQEGAHILSTIYDNKQNVHLESIEESIKNAVQQLAMTCLDVIDFQDARETLRLICSAKDLSAFDIALFRIEYNISHIGEYSLCDIFLMVYAYIQRHAFKDELMNRLCEELVDMHDTCASGYYERLINALSGYGITVSISWEEQIASNLIGRLNACIRDEREADSILTELTTNTSHWDERPELLKMFRKHISQIREEMACEFVEFMTETDFDLYFRKALVRFDGFKFD